MHIYVYVLYADATVLNNIFLLVSVISLMVYINKIKLKSKLKVFSLVGYFPFKNERFISLVKSTLRADFADRVQTISFTTGQTINSSSISVASTGLKKNDSQTETSLR